MNSSGFSLREDNLSVKSADKQQNDPRHLRLTMWNAIHTSSSTYGRVRLPGRCFFFFFPPGKVTMGVNAIIVSLSIGKLCMHLLPSGQAEMKARNMGVIDNRRSLEANLKDTTLGVGVGVFRERDKIKISLC